MGGSDQWVAQASLGTARDIVCIDLPGFGHNAHLAPLDRIGEYADWVLEEVSRRGVERFDLLGHSMGGMVVQEMVHRAPARVRKLILYSTGAIGVLPGRFETIETSIQRAQDDGAEATARRISATWFLEKENDPAYPACASVAVKSSPGAIAAGLRAMQAWSGEAYLSEVKSPTLLVWGSGDRTYPWSQIENLWTNIADVQLSVVPNCAHAVHMERPRVFNLLVDEFLST